MKKLPKEMLPNGAIYLATPYSSPDSALQECRFEEAARIAAGLMSFGLRVFCPIAHSHPIAVLGGVGEDGGSLDFWLNQDLWVLEGCDLLVVAHMDGWKNSKGIKAEIAFAEATGIPVVHMTKPIIRQLLKKGGE